MWFSSLMPAATRSVSKYCTVQKAKAVKRPHGSVRSSGASMQAVQAAMQSQPSKFQNSALTNFVTLRGRPGARCSHT
eukprot:CAMPEP_0198563498 /NCGR_PEP_ID=MMETSP1462-20131121/98830_1 /TAXON_ID=1333877 /ORGANISM="Brandtodinium nutriculum, Strain RCC3387" /LENGTH=76 /DNA_ID=CAMNT_0044294445 /DNA_START=141 /DNA_END=367 /DNA_ORIENTATION=+